MLPGIVALFILAPGAEAQSPGSVLVPTGRTAVIDTDTLFLAVPVGLALGETGNIYVVERRERRVLEVDPAGRIRRAFGRSGRGPGEFESPSTMALSGDTLLAVHDRATRRITLIDLRTGNHQAIVPLQEAWPPTMRFAGPELLVLSWDLDARTALATVDLTGRVRQREGVVPPIGLKHPMLMRTQFRSGFFTLSGPDVFAIFELSPNLFRWTRGSRDGIEIAIPKLRRKSVTDAFFETLLQDPSRAATMIWERSIPRAIEVVTPSIVALVTADVRIDGATWSATHHLTLVDHQASRACVDIEVPAARLPVNASDPLPDVALRGNLMVLLEPELGASGEPVYTIRRFQIDPAACATWTPIR
jgi:hypothetical protein